MPGPSSATITTLDEARAFYATLVGTHTVKVGEKTVSVRFARGEIHPFTESIREGSKPPAHLLVTRPDGSGEVRIFSRTRARFLDRILPTLEHPAACVRAKGPGAIMVIGPSGADGWRMAVVLNRHGEEFVVRTAYPIDGRAFASYTRSSSAKRCPWPPT